MITYQCQSIPRRPLDHTNQFLHLTEIWLMSGLQSFYHIKRGRLHLLRTFNYPLLLLHGHDAIKHADNIGGRDVLEGCILLIAPHGAHTMRFEQRSPVLALGSGDVVEEGVEGGIFADEERAGLHIVKNVMLLYLLCGKK